MSAGVVVVGSLNVDHVITVDELPLTGQTVAGFSYVSVPGGKGLNQAVAAARQGAPTSMVGCVGSDRAGDVLTVALADAGVGVAAVRRAQGVPSGTALITVARGGANTVVVAAAANGSLSVEDVDAAADVIGRAGVLLCQLEVPLIAVETALREARRAGAVTVLNPAPASAPLPRDVLSQVDVLVPNETEAESLTGETDPAVAAAALVAAGCRLVIVTLGSKGALYLDGAKASDAICVPAIPVDVVDTTAAGDAFCGSLAASLSQDGSLTAARLADLVRRSVAAGALATTAMGALPSLPDASAVDALLSEVRG